VGCRFAFTIPVELPARADVSAADPGTTQPAELGAR
jgi:hypothetical protein